MMILNCPYQAWLKAAVGGIHAALYVSLGILTVAAFFSLVRGKENRGVAAQFPSGKAADK